MFQHTYDTPLRVYTFLGRKLDIHSEHNLFLGKTTAIVQGAYDAHTYIHT